MSQGDGVGQDTRGNTGEMEGGGGGERDAGGDAESWRRRETDGSKCEGGSRLSTGEELCFRSALPEICFHHADREREGRAEQHG